MSCCSHLQLHLRRAFSLVEAAIVLAVVGLVIGGIWTAAATVTENHRINETAIGILSLGRSAQSLLLSGGFPTGANATAYYSTQNSIMRAINNGIFPYDNANAAYTTPYGYISLALGTDAAALPSDITFVLYGFSLRPATCNKLIAAIMNAVKDRNMLTLLWIDGRPPYGDVSVVPPFDFSTFSCPADIINIQVHFSPRP